MRMLVSCVLVAALTVAASGASARVRTGKLAGTVLERGDVPAVGAEVMIERSDGSAPIAVRTDAQGRFRFDFLRPGLYDIRASLTRASTPWKHNIIVRSGRKTVIDLRLEPIKGSPRR